MGARHRHDLVHHHRLARTLVLEAREVGERALLRRAHLVVVGQQVVVLLARDDLHGRRAVAGRADDLVEQRHPRVPRHRVARSVVRVVHLVQRVAAGLILRRAATMQRAQVLVLLLDALGQRVHVVGLLALRRAVARHVEGHAQRDGVGDPVHLAKLRHLGQEAARPGLVVRHPHLGQRHGVQRRRVHLPHVLAFLGEELAHVAKVVHLVVEARVAVARVGPEATRRAQVLGDVEGGLGPKGALGVEDVVHGLLGALRDARHDARAVEAAQLHVTAHGQVGVALGSHGELGLGRAAGAHLGARLLVGEHQLVQRVRQAVLRADVAVLEQAQAVGHEVVRVLAVRHALPCDAQRAGGRHQRHGSRLAVLVHRARLPLGLAHLLRQVAGQPQDAQDVQRRARVVAFQVDEPFGVGDPVRGVELELPDGGDVLLPVLGDIRARVRGRHAVLRRHRLDELDRATVHQRRISRPLLPRALGRNVFSSADGDHLLLLLPRGIRFGCQARLSLLCTGRALGVACQGRSRRLCLLHGGIEVGIVVMQWLDSSS